MGGIGTRIPFGSQGPKVLVSIPNTGWVHKLVAQNMICIAATPFCQGDIIMPSHVPFENNLHHIIVDLLRGDYDYWLTFDADNSPRRNPLELVRLDKDIIGCPTPVWNWTEEAAGDRPIYWNAYDYDAESGGYREHLPYEGLQKVDAVGTGCVLFARRVFEHPELQSGAFVRMLNSDGTVEKGNDISFCERATRCGVEIYAHYEYPCYHINELDLGEVNHAFLELFDATAAV